MSQASIRKDNIPTQNSPRKQTQLKERVRSQIRGSYKPAAVNPVNSAEKKRYPQRLEDKPRLEVARPATIQDPRPKTSNYGPL